MEDYGCRVSDHWLNGQLILAKHRTPTEAAIFLSAEPFIEANVKP